ncbi:hypothetical protein QBC42DRAFT_180435 [Cladorrhinum samala]|uniref:Uncharacterized protein n=1 Tax=Cladorrhinum samala TaxID=585594 RepID=A0AAV9HMN0_9PEZI|nr:hypothetical protein QBC42DRAFT_180435 [Cladorrhinum samala]
MTRKLSLVVFLWAAVLALGQKPLECTREVAASDECADVINPAACYNQFRWNSRTLSCIDATSDAERKRKACLCCNCVGSVMCNWVNQNRYCT